MLDSCIDVNRVFIAPVTPTSAEDIPGVSLLTEVRFEEPLSGAASTRFRLPSDDPIDDVVKACDAGW